MPKNFTIYCTALRCGNTDRTAVLWCGRYIYLLVRSGVAPPAVAWLAYALVTSDKHIAPGYRCAAAQGYFWGLGLNLPLCLKELLLASGM